MTKFKLQYPIAVCYNKRWFAVGGTFCAFNEQAVMGYSNNLKQVISATVVGLLEPTLHWWNGSTSKFLKAVIFSGSGLQKLKLKGGLPCLTLTASIPLVSYAKTRKSTL